MTFAARLIGVVIVLQGVVGLAAPEFFTRLIGLIQTPPTIYGAAIVRILFGVVLIAAAPPSRSPTLLRCLGGLILVGGVLTPFLGVQFAHAILGWWVQSVSVVRAFAVAALAIGGFILFATARRRSAA